MNAVKDRERKIGEVGAQAWRAAEAAMMLRQFVTSSLRHAAFADNAAVFRTQMSATPAMFAANRAMLMRASNISTVVHVLPRVVYSFRKQSSLRYTMKRGGRR